MSSYAPRPTGNHNHTLNKTSSSLRHPSSAATASTSTSSTHAQTHLQTRIAAKRAELENLRQLRDLSGELASQLAALEQKLSTLRDGAQSVALVLANWDNVLRAIGMAAGMYSIAMVLVLHLVWVRHVIVSWEVTDDCADVVKVPVPTAAGRDGEVEDDGASGGTEKNPELPVPLVRIPVQHKTEDGG